MPLPQLSYIYWHIHFKILIGLFSRSVYIFNVYSKTWSFFSFLNVSSLHSGKSLIENRKCRVARFFLKNMTRRVDTGFVLLGVVQFALQHTLLGAQSILENHATCGRIYSYANLSPKGNISTRRWTPQRIFMRVTWQNSCRDHSFSTYTNFFEKLAFLTSLIFRKILRMY